MFIYPEVFLLLFKLIISFIFISTGYSKFKKFDEHVFSINEYKIFSSKYAKLVAILIISLELYVGIFLFLGLFLRFTSILGIITLTIFTITIVIKLIHGEKNINCGCGGVLGEQKLSWRLVIRNLFINFLLIIVFFNPFAIGNLDSLIRKEQMRIIFGGEYFATLLFSILLILVILISEKLFRLYFKIRDMFRLEGEK